MRCDRDIEVVLERSFDRVLERERHARSGRNQGSARATALAGGWPATACPAAKRLGGSFKRLCADAGTATRTARRAQKRMCFISEDYDKTRPKVSPSRVWDGISHRWTGEKTMALPAATYFDALRPTFNTRAAARPRKNAPKLSSAPSFVSSSSRPYGKAAVAKKSATVNPIPR